MGDRYQQGVGIETAPAFVGKLELATWGAFAETTADSDGAESVRADAPHLELSLIHI